MASVTFTNLTPEQAKTFAHWFEGQGEQDCDVWFDIHGVPSPLVDVQHEDSMKIEPNGDVIVRCRTP